MAVLDAMVERDLVDTRRGIAVTDDGMQWLHDLGVDRRRCTARAGRWPGPAWTGPSGAPHLAGAAGAALCARLLDTGWVERGTGRTVRVTEPGQRGLRRLLGLTPAVLEPAR